MASLTEGVDVKCKYWLEKKEFHCKWKVHEESSLEAELQNVWINKWSEHSSTGLQLLSISCNKKLPLELWTPV